MDMDAMVTDSHQLMMSEEQRHHLFKVRRAYSDWKEPSFPRSPPPAGVAADSSGPQVPLLALKS